MHFTIKWTIPYVIHYGPGSVLWGTTGNDYHYGTSYDDRMMGSEGADRFYAGRGDDIADYRYSPEAVTVLLDAWEGGAPIARGGYAEGDLLFGVRSLVGSAFDDTFGGQSYASGTFDGGRGYDTMTYQSMRSREGVTIDFTQGADGEALVDKGRNTDTLINIEKVVGTDHDDRFIADEYAADFDGGAGFDTADFSQGFERSLRFIATETGFTATNYERNVSIALENVEHIIGTDSRDNFYGSDRDDHFEGRGGRDRFFISEGADIYDGGDGDDDILRGGDLALVTIDLAAGTGTGGAVDGDTYISIENVQVTGVAITVRGNAGDNFLDVIGNYNTVEAGGGDDRVQFGGLHGTVSLGDGDDQLFLDTIANYAMLDGGDGRDLLLVDDAHQDLDDPEFGFQFDVENGEITSLSPDEDISFRFTGFEVIRGTTGADTFIDGDGTSTLYSGWGLLADLFIFEHRDSGNADVIQGFELGEDIIDLSGSTVDNFRTLTIQDADEINSNDPLRDFMYQDGGDAVIVTNSGLGNSIRLIDVDVYDLSRDDFIF